MINLHIFAQSFTRYSLLIHWHLCYSLFCDLKCISIIWYLIWNPYHLYGMWFGRITWMTWKFFSQSNEKSALLSYSVIEILTWNNCTILFLKFAILESTLFRNKLIDTVFINMFVLLGTKIYFLKLLFCMVPCRCLFLNVLNKVMFFKVLCGISSNTNGTLLSEVKWTGPDSRFMCLWVHKHILLCPLYFN